MGWGVKRKVQYTGKIGVPEHPLPIFEDQHISLTINQKRGPDSSGEDWSERVLFPPHYLQYGLCTSENHYTILIYICSK
jgi:hypothetical protein